LSPPAELRAPLPGAPSTLALAAADRDAGAAVAAGPADVAGAADAPAYVAVATLAGLLELPIEQVTAGLLGCAAGPARLARAWPRRDGSLAVELRDAAGAVVAGQWRPDRDDLRRVARQTAAAGPGGSAVVTAPGDRRFVLQARADRRLPGLGAALDRPGAVLVGHRAEQRAVVRAGASHIKVTRPQRAAAATVAAQRAAALTHAAGDPFAVAVPSATDPALGLLVLPTLPGTSLAGRMVDGGLRAGARAAGRATAALHAAAVPPGTPTHGAVQEAGVLERWLALLAPHAPALAGRAAARAAPVTRALLEAPAAAPVPLHRDLHDGQVLVDADGAVALLDLDTLAAGEAALDVANLLVHLELAALQGRCRPERAAGAAAAFLEGYGEPPPADRLAAHADAARLRLVCVHAFRPAPEGLLEALLARVGAGAPSCLIFDPEHANV